MSSKYEIRIGKRLIVATDTNTHQGYSRLNRLWGEWHDDEQDPVEDAQTINALERAVCQAVSSGGNPTVPANDRPRYAPRHRRITRHRPRMRNEGDRE